MANREIYEFRVKTLLHLIIDKSYSANSSNEFRTKVRQAIEAINRILKGSSIQIKNLQIAITYVGETLEYQPFMHRDKIDINDDVYSTSSCMNDAIINGVINMVHHYDSIEKTDPVHGFMFIFANSYDDYSLYSLDDVRSIIQDATSERRIGICIAEGEDSDFWEMQLDVPKKVLNEQHEIGKILFMSFM